MRGGGGGGEEWKEGRKEGRKEAVQKKKHVRILDEVLGAWEHEECEKSVSVRAAREDEERERKMSVG